MGALERGPGLDGHRAGGFAADADDVVAGLRVLDLVERDGGVVHGDPADDGAGAAADEEAAAVGEREGEPVGVAGGDGADAHVARADEGAAVADRAAGRERAHLGEARPQGEHGAEAEPAVSVEAFITITSSSGKVIKIPMGDLPVLARPAKGNMVINLDEGENVTAVAVSYEKEND